MRQPTDPYVAETRALLQRALSHQWEGRLAEAELAYEQVLLRHPNHFDALHMLGVLALQTQQPERAVEFLKRALPQKPTNAAAHKHLAQALADLGRFAESILSYAIAIALRPGFADAYIGLANALRELDRLDEALMSCDRAIALRPDVARGYICRALILRSMQRPEEMLAACDKALLTQPELSDTWDKLGAALREMNQLEEALMVFETAISEWPDCPSPHMNAGVVHLQLGRTEPGWREYDWRNKPGGPTPGRAWTKPRWNGDQSLAGKTIMIWAEQGLGDTIQFCRYATLLESRGANVIFSVQAQLCTLLRTLGSTITVTSESETPPEFDLHCALLSLPLAFGTTIATIPAAVPYLAADPHRVLRWRQKLGSKDLKIGICWQGSKLPIDIGRSYPLKVLHRISEIPGVRLISLQKGPGSEQLANMPAGMRVETLGEEFDAGSDAFVDTAAVMENLDLVITSDTSIAHLAGALGHPTWVALKHVPEWRWFLERDDSPWYPRHRLFRQQRRGDWADVFERLRVELLGLLARRRG
ncbi:MAG: tetratricopeptide repeat protein [Steroidobacteraceae bacterium]